MRMLERESQLDALAQYAGEARAGQGRLVLVAGEAGVGKSSLLEELESRVTDARWCWGACDGLFTPRPLGPLLDISQVLGGELSQLCRSEASRERIFTALLRQVSESDVLNVLAVEDVHWADAATLDLLRFLGRRVRSARVLILVTYRDDGLGADDPLRVALGELATQRPTRRLDLPPLSAQAVQVLAAGTGVEPAELYRLTGGNPFFVTEVLREHDGELPTSARDAVLSRIARLGNEARQVLDAAALIGARVEPSLLAAVTGLRAAAVDEVVASGLVTDDGDRLRFRHEIARLTVEQAVPAHRRAPLHERIVVALLAESCKDDSRLAFHAEAAGDTELVMKHAPAAARRAAELAAHREAVAQYQRALRFADGDDARTRAGLYEGLAREASLVDRWQDSANASEAALALWRELGDLSREGSTLGLLSRAVWRLCRGREASTIAEEAVSVLEPLGPTVELAWAYANLAGTRMDQSRNAEALELVARARSIAEPHRLIGVLSDTLTTEGYTRASMGEPWEEIVDRGLNLALDTDMHGAAARAYVNIAILYGREQRFDEGARYVEEGIACCDDHDITTYGRCIRGERAAWLAKRGRWDESVALCRQLLAQGGASLVNRMNPLTTMGVLSARRGDAGVWECLDEANAAAIGLDEPQWIVMARLARAEARWLAGEHEAALIEARAAASAAVPYDLRGRSETAVWCRRLGDPVVASEVLMEPYASLFNGDFTGAAARWDALGCSYDVALALLESNDEVMMRDALARLEALGALAAARVARQRMRDLGIRSVPAGARAQTREHPAGLTRREREVLELICEGHSNDEISGRLVISVKTVDHHVSAVLGKLGVPSRKVAAAEAVRLGLVSSRR